MGVDRRGVSTAGDLEFMGAREGLTGGMEVAGVAVDSGSTTQFGEEVLNGRMDFN